jgi:proteic killer suppression protein
VIKSFADKETERLFRGRKSKAATNIEDLRAPPGNRLEKLRGDREGQYSIRVNRQYRVCFSWIGADAHDVEITDYH